MSDQTYLQGEIVTEFLLIGGHRKSGTTLLRVLCGAWDGAYAPPFDLNVFYAVYPSWTSEDVSDDELAARLRVVVLQDWSARLASGAHAEAVPRVKRLNEAFEDLIRTQIPRTVSSLFNFAQDLITVIAPADTSLLILKETSSELYVPLLKESQLSSLHFVQLFRDPRDNWAAIAAGMPRYLDLGDSRNVSLDSLLLRVSLGWQFSRGPVPALMGSYQLARFEDIVADAQVAVADLTKHFRGLVEPPTDLILLEEGKWFVGNSYDGQITEGVSQDKVGRWRERIPAHEADLITGVLWPLMVELQYLPPDITTGHLDYQRAAARWYARTSQEYFFSDPFDMNSDDA